MGLNFCKNLLLVRSGRKYDNIVDSADFLSGKKYKIFLWGKLLNDDILLT